MKVWILYMPNEEGLACDNTDLVIATMEAYGDDEGLATTEAGRKDFQVSLEALKSGEYAIYNDWTVMCREMTEEEFESIPAGEDW
jgi:hypothetical protein